MSPEKDQSREDLRRKPQTIGKIFELEGVEGRAVLALHSDADLDSLIQSAIRVSASQRIPVSFYFEGSYSVDPADALKTLNGQLPHLEPEQNVWDLLDRCGIGFDLEPGTAKGKAYRTMERVAQAQKFGPIFTIGGEEATSVSLDPFEFDLP